MSQKPGDWFVGVIDLFAIVLPGAILTAAIGEGVRDAVFGPVFPPLTRPEQGWVAFFIASFVLGHFLFGFASAFDPLYNVFRTLLVPKHRDHAFRRASRLMAETVGAEHVNVTNPYRWSRSLMLVRHPAMAAEVHRYEAISKFFRSFVVVLLILSVLLLVRGEVAGVAVTLGLAVISFWQYGENRWKTTRQAYEYLVVSHHLPAAKEQGAEAAKSPAGSA